MITLIGGKEMDSLFKHVGKSRETGMRRPLRK